MQTIPVSISFATDYFKCAKCDCERGTERPGFCPMDISRGVENPRRTNQVPRVLDAYEISYVLIPAIPEAKITSMEQLGEAVGNESTPDQPRMF